MAARLLSVLDDNPDSELTFSSRERLLHLTATHLQLYPYCLVEFKQALGHILPTVCKTIHTGGIPIWIFSLAIWVDALHRMSADLVIKSVFTRGGSLPFTRICPASINSGAAANS
jgi:hypothetical protein